MTSLMLRFSKVRNTNTEYSIIANVLSGVAVAVSG